MSKEKPVRVEVLETSIKLTAGDRNKTYGSPEPNLALQMALWSLLDNSLKAKTCHGLGHDAALQHVCAKLARIASSAVLHRDNYVDAAAYMAIAYECAVEAERLK